MMQEELLLRSNPKEDFSDEFLFKCSSFKEALKLSKTFSGLDDKQICYRLGIDPGQWSRIWSGQAHFPEEKLEEFIRLCGNLIPLRWLALKFGYGLHPLRSALELELDKERQGKEELQKRLVYFEELIKKVRL